MSSTFITPGAVGQAVIGAGVEIGYDQTVSPVNVTSVTEASGDLVVQGSAYVFDGGLVLCEFFASRAISGSSGVITMMLFEGSTEITRLALVGGNAVGVQAPVCAHYRFAPTAGPHTYKVTAYSPSAASIQAGNGGTATDPPAYLRFTKV